MNTTVERDVNYNMSFEAVERKGIGHPDSMADMIADEFSKVYIKTSLEKWGGVLNHWVDKTTLIGASTIAHIGRFFVKQPIQGLLIGKISDGLPEAKLDLYELFHEASSHVLGGALNAEIPRDNICLKVVNSVGNQPDHARNFYAPSTADVLQTRDVHEQTANDTVICSAYAMKNNLGDLVRRLENKITSPTNGLIVLYPQVGTDVKILAFREGNEIGLTLCVPIHPERIRTRSDYNDILWELKRQIFTEASALARRQRCKVVSLKLNTKDNENSAYIAPFGTALGKGDCGVVGRGNRINGIINNLRPATTEAPSGKNPLHHVGKIYTMVCQLYVNTLVHRFDVDYASLCLITCNGADLRRPMRAYLQVSGGQVSDQELSEALNEYLENCPSLWMRFIESSTLECFREGRVV